VESEHSGGVSVLRTSFGEGILVISGRRRTMYQSLVPKAGGDNLALEVKLQGLDRTPHDTTAGPGHENQLK
jgi:hypothetical protein